MGSEIPYLDAYARAEKALADSEERERRYDDCYLPGSDRSDAAKLRTALRDLIDERLRAEIALLASEPAKAPFVSRNEEWGLRPDFTTAGVTAPPAGAEVREAAFAQFGRALLPLWWDDGNPGDIDGSAAQDAAEASGLWRRVERHADGVECEWCNNEEPCGELTEIGRSALRSDGR